jgi:hypothetical protein
MVNLNTFAKEITLKEGLEKSLTIAQVKEVIRLVLIGMKSMTFEEVLNLIKKQK